MKVSEVYLKRFRRLPTPLLILLIFSRFILGLGLGALLAGQTRSYWKLLGGFFIVLSFALALPGAVKILEER